MKSEGDNFKISRISCLIIGVFFLCFISLFFIDLIIFIVEPGWGVSINRLGIFLQLLGISSILPEVISKERFSIWEGSFSNLGDQLKNEFRLIAQLSKNMDITILFKEGIVRRANLVSKIVMCTWVFRVLWFSYTNPNNVSSENDWFLVVLSIMAFTWTILLLLHSVFYVTHNKPPRVLRVLFMPIDVVLTVAGWPFTLVFVYLLRPVLGILQFLSKYPFRKVLMWVTFPLIALGTTLQLIATFF